MNIPATVSSTIRTQRITKTEEMSEKSKQQKSKNEDVLATAQKFIEGQRSENAKKRDQI